MGVRIALVLMVGLTGCGFATVGDAPRVDSRGAAPPEGERAPVALETPRAVERTPVPEPADEPAVPPADQGEPALMWADLTVPMRPIYPTHEPADEHVGTLRRGHPFPVYERQPGRRCKTDWARVGAEGWVCGDFLVEVKRPVDVESTDPLPFEYATLFEDTEIHFEPHKWSKTGKIRKKKSTVSILERQGKWVRAYPNQWLPAKNLVDRPDRTSTLEGVILDDTTVYPFAFVRHNHVFAYPEPNLSKGERRRFKSERVAISRFSRHPILDTYPAGASLARADYVKLDAGWVVHWRLGTVDIEPRPSRIKGTERWLLIDKSEQTLVAYVGDRPVYATMTSTGKDEDKGPTPVGMWRITHKLRSGRMSGGTGASYHYLSDVPWIQYFNGGVALHGVYWHNAFGWPTSNGCVNLTPADAMWLFDFTGPTLPEGWYSQMAERHAGTWVVVRD